MLYPNDEPIQGKELRLEQQYFFVSSSLQDMIRFHLGRGRSLETFHEKFAVQLNDTHPAIGVAELMRLLVDEHQLAVGQSLGNYPQKPLPYQPHPAAGSPWRSGPSTCSGRLPAPGT